MKASQKLCFLAFVWLLVSGCQSMVQSTREGLNYKKDREEKGQYYYLPKSVVKVTGVWDSTLGTWDLTATPMFGADTNDGVFMVRRHPIYVMDDTVTFASDPTSGLLQTVNGSSTDQTVNSLASVAAAAASFSGLPTAIGNFTTAARETAEINTLEERFYQERQPEPKIEKKTWHLESQDIDNAMKAYDTGHFLETLTNAQFSAFQTYLDPAVLGNDSNKCVYVMSPMANNQVTYGKFELKLTKLFDTDTTNRQRLPAMPEHPWLKSLRFDYDRDENRFNGVLVRDPIPCQLMVTGLLWFAHFKTNVNGVKNQFLADAGGNQMGASQNNQSPPWEGAWPLNLKALTNCFELDFPDKEFTPRKYLAMEQTFTLADVNHTRSVDIGRTPLVQDSSSLTIVNGMVQSRQFTRPSVVMGIFGIPKTLLTAIVPLPGGSGGGGGGGNSSSGGGNGGGNNANSNVSGGANGSGNGGGQGNNSSPGSQQGQANTAQFAPVQ